MSTKIRFIKKNNLISVKPSNKAHTNSQPRGCYSNSNNPMRFCIFYFIFVWIYTQIQRRHEYTNIGRYENDKTNQIFPENKYNNNNRFPTGIASSSNRDNRVRRKSVSISIRNEHNIPMKFQMQLFLFQMRISLGSISRALYAPAI